MFSKHTFGQRTYGFGGTPSSVKSTGKRRNTKARRYPKRRQRAPIVAAQPVSVSAPAPVSKPKGREFFVSLFAAFEEARDSKGIYHPIATTKRVVACPPCKIEKPKRTITLNPNRFGPSPMTDLQSAGMPGNEETDPGYWH